MTPKEKAKELICKYQNLDIEVGGQYDGYITLHNQDAKQCALIAVDEILSTIEVGLNDYKSLEKINYWQEVKQEINNL